MHIFVFAFIQPYVQVDELKRSVHFYTKANTNLKAQNADLERQLLMAKQAILFNKETKSKAASAKAAAPVASNTLPTMDMPAFAAASFFGNKSKQDIESEAMLAQFAATQALYASMGYPSAAARAAAATFSSVSTPAAPVPPPEVKEPTKTISPQSTPSTALQSNPFANFYGMMSNNTSLMKSMGASLPDSTSNSCIDMDRIEDLNQFAMQQAAAANAAAAAATAAIKAANFHRQMKGSASKSMPMPMFAFPFAQFPGFQAP